MFTLEELDTALGEVHQAFTGTPQYAWPLLAGRVGAEVSLALVAESGCSAFGPVQSQPDIRTNVQQRNITVPRERRSVED